MKIKKPFIAILLLILVVGLRATVMQASDTRFLYRTQKGALIEHVEVSGTYHKTYTDTQKAKAFAQYTQALSTLATAEQNKQVADSQMWAKRQLVLTAQNTINYKNNNTTNPATKDDYTDIEKHIIDSSLTQATKEYSVAQKQFLETDIAIKAAQSQVELSRIEYEDTLVDEPLLIVFVNEIYYPKLSIGQKVVVTFDALKDVSLVGRVEEIDSVGIVQNGSVVFETKISIESLPEIIKPNMTAMARIELMHKENVIFVPTSAIVYENGKTYVHKETSKNGELTEVILGEKGFTKVEVISGLDEGESIMARPGTKKL